MSDVFQQRIQALCKGRSVTECARLWGFKQATLHNYVSGQRSPTGEAIRQICLATGTSADWLLGIDASDSGPGNHRAEVAEEKLRVVKTTLISLVSQM